MSDKSEHQIQRDLIIRLATEARTDIFYFAVPNGGLRNPRVASQMKAEGLRPGVADLCFMLPGGRSAWLELKKPGGALSDAQHGFKTRCIALDHLWAMAKSVDEALSVLDGWGVLKPAEQRVAA